MDEHVHEWRWRYLGAIPKCKVDGCGKSMHYDEVERRLNATERLSAEDATVIANGWTSNATLRDTLRAYADTLEGK